MSSFLVVGSILAIQFQRFLCSFYSVQLVLTSSGIPMLKPNFCDGNQHHGPASDVACSPLFEGKKWVADKNNWACIFRYIQRILIHGEGQKGISDPEKGQFFRTTFFQKKFFRTTIGDSQQQTYQSLGIEFSINWTCDLSMCATVF